jgi:hypothetical protein
MLVSRVKRNGRARLSERRFGNRQSRGGAWHAVRGNPGLANEVQAPAWPAQTLEWVSIGQRCKLLLGNSLEVSFGENRLGSNAIHPNAVWAGLCCNILGHEFDPSLRDGVRDRRPGVRTAPSRRGDRDDPATSAFFHTRQKALKSKECRVRFPSTEARHPSSLVSSSGPGGVKLPPAFATRMSTGPNSPSIRRRAASTSVKFVTSPLTCIERPPASSISFRMEDSAAPSLPWTTTLAPCCANDLAIAAPMPHELPVISAT